MGSCNEAELGFEFLPKKRKAQSLSNGPRKKQKLDVNEDPFSDLENFDHILEERSSDGELEYSVMWVDSGEASWEKPKNICPVLINIWKRDKPSPTSSSDKK